MELMRNDIMRAIVGVIRILGTDDGYEEVVEDFEVVGFSGQDRIYQVDKSMEK